MVNPKYERLDQIRDERSNTTLMRWFDPAVHTPARVDPRIKAIDRHGVELYCPLGYTSAVQSDIYSLIQPSCRMKTLRIFLIEDNRILREGIAATINGEADMRVVASSAGGNGTLLEVRKLRPHLVLMDLSLRNQNDIRVVASLTEEVPGIKVIGMGLIPSQVDTVELVEAGASGFILKDATVKEFLDAIRSVARGAKVLPASLTGSLFSHLIENALKKGKGKLISAVRMTKRERQIIALIADGFSNKDIAQRLNIATYTVKSHVHNILEKLAIHSRLQIAVFARDDEDS